MNDAILSSLLNLFALYNTKAGIDRDASRKVLSNYLSHHFGIRNLDEQLNFYDELVSHYDSTQDIDRNALTREISSKVREKLLEELTVYENLLFTARLCFDGLGEEELDRKVMALLHDLGLEAAKDLKAGSPINKYISGGQRKRLNIALELIREPDVLFLDEPTSGLSSADTNAVVNLLREQAYKGRLIIANIHQPSSDVFKLFDRFWGAGG